MRTFFDPFGSLAESYREVDWASTPLGDVTSWSEALLNAVDLMTHTRFPVALLWSPEFEGVMDIATETTSQVISRRRLQLLTELNARLADAQDATDLLRGALPLLRGAVRDFPAVDICLHGLPTRRDAALPSSPLSATDGGVEAVEKYGDRLVARLPLSSSESPAPSHLVVALNPRLASDEEYLGFLRLVASSLRQALDRMQARTAERRPPRPNAACRRRSSAACSPCPWHRADLRSPCGTSRQRSWPRSRRATHPG